MKERRVRVARVRVRTELWSKVVDERENAAAA